MEVLKKYILAKTKANKQLFFSKLFCCFILFYFIFLFLLLFLYREVNRGAFTKM